MVVVCGVPLVKKEERGEKPRDLTCTSSVVEVAVVILVLSHDKFFGFAFLAIKSYNSLSHALTHARTQQQ